MMTWPHLIGPCNSHSKQACQLDLDPLTLLRPPAPLPTSPRALHSRDGWIALAHFHRRGISWNLPHLLCCHVEICGPLLPLAALVVQLTERHVGGTVSWLLREGASGNRKSTDPKSQRTGKSQPPEISTASSKNRPLARQLVRSGNQHTLDLDTGTPTESTKCACNEVSACSVPEELNGRLPPPLHHLLRCFLRPPTLESDTHTLESDTRTLESDTHPYEVLCRQHTQRLL